MSAEALNPHRSNAVPREVGETLTDGANQITTIQLTEEQFMASEDQRMVALVKLYQDRCTDGLPPTVDAIRPEDIFSTGMMNRTHLIRIDSSDDQVRYAVWAQDANFDGYRNLQNAHLKNLTTDAAYGLMFKAVKKQLVAARLHGRPAYYEMKGYIHDRYYYFTKAVLPLRSEQGEIIKCLVPFTNKLPNVPTNLRQELLATNVDQ